MGHVALCLAGCGVLAVALPGAGKYLAIGLGILAVAAGARAFRRREAAGGPRLLGAAGVAVGSAALLLGAAKVGLTLMAVERLAHVLQ